MKKTGKTVKMFNIAGRDVGEETLECSSCGRFWGKDSVKKPEEGHLPEIKGICPECGGLVLEHREVSKYKASKKVDSDE